MPIDHFVVVMMENRSFDHYFGWLGETGLVDGLQQATYLDPQGNPVETRHASSMGAAEWQGCGHPDPGHGWGSGRAQLNGGFMADGSGNDEFALTYYDEGELGFIHGAANAYTVYDRWFCSQLGPTWPNRYYKWSGQSGGKNNNSVARRHARQPVGDDLRRRAPQRRDGALLQLGPAVLGDVRRSAARPGRARSPSTTPTQRSALLPNITFVDPPFRDGGGFDGNSADEHPHGDVRLGPGVDGRRREGVRRVAELRARRALRHLRRVGRLLRPRQAAERAGRPPEREPRRGLRPDGLPDPRRDHLAVHAQPLQATLFGSATASTAPSRS